MSNKQPDAVLIAKIAYKLIEENKEALLAHSLDEVRTILSGPLHPHEIKALTSTLGVLPTNMNEGSIWLAHPINEHGVDESVQVYIVAHTPQRDSFLMIHDDKAHLVNYTDFHPVHCLWTIKPTLGEPVIRSDARFMPGEESETATTPPHTESRDTSLFNTAFDLMHSVRENLESTPNIDSDNDYLDINDTEEFKDDPVDYIYNVFDSLNEDRLEEINDMLSNIKNFKNQKGS